MKRNFILTGAVALALGTAGVASAAETAEDCSSRAMQLQQVVEQSTMTDSDKAELASTLSEAQTADLARCEQIVSRVEREVGAAPDESMDPTMERSMDSSAADPSGTGDEYSTPGKSPTSATTGDDSYPAGAESPESTLRGKPGADAYDTENPAVSATGEPQGGYESPESTVDVEAGDMDGTESTAGTSDPQDTAGGYGAGTATGATSMAGAQDPSTGAQDTSGAYGTDTAQDTSMAQDTTTSASPLAQLSAEDLVNKPVHTVAGEEVGEIDKIVTDKAKSTAYAVIGVGGMFGLGEKKVLLDVDQLQVNAQGELQVPAAGPDELEGYPEYDEDAYVEYEGAMSAVL